MHNGSLLIDMHVHLAQYEVLSASTRDWFISLYPSEAAYQAVCEANASPDDFCAMLAEKGVDYAVILAEDTPAVTGVADNRMVADFCKGHPQLLPFCTFDPLKEKDMPGQLRQLAAEGFRGVKLYPTYNFFYPNAPMMYPLYETAQELGLPVMFHTGLSVFRSSRLKYGSPIFYDDIAVDFPELKIVMCHGGRDCWYREAQRGHRQKRRRDRPTSAAGGGHPGHPGRDRQAPFGRIAQRFPKGTPPYAGHTAGSFFSVQQAAPGHRASSNFSSMTVSPSRLQVELGCCSVLWNPYF